MFMFFVSSCFLVVNAVDSKIMKSETEIGDDLGMIEKTLSEKYIFRGKFLDLHVDEVLLPNGKRATREIIEHKGAACVAALTSENEVLFVKQFRCPFKKIFLELPAGKLDGDEPLECAKRELLEETGSVGKDFVSLGKMYPTVAYCTEVIHMFACKVTDFEKPKPDDDEFVEMVKIPLNEAVQMVLNGEISDAKTQIGILKLKELQYENNC